MGMMFHRALSRVLENNTDAITTTQNIDKGVEKSTPVVSVDPVVDEVETKTYSKTEINRMSTNALKELANDNGVVGADEMTGAELKRILIDKLVD